MPRIYVSKIEAHYGVVAFYEHLIRHLNYTKEQGDWSAEERKTVSICLKMIEKFKRANGGRAND